MTLTQLRYLVCVAEAGSMSQAAARLFVAQPSLSKSIADLEAEMGVQVFLRTSRGVVLTEEGSRLLSYARQVVEDADSMERAYKGTDLPRKVFAVSTQHYAFVVNAFVSLVREYEGGRYEFSLRESTTAAIIDDVRLRRSELGVLYRSHFNREAVTSAIRKAELEFEPLLKARPHVFVSRRSPLAKMPVVTMDDLAPYPRLSYDQGLQNSFYFAEEPHITESVDKAIVVTDRATLFNLVIGLDGYTICSGILSEDLNGTEIVAVPLASDEEMEVGYVHDSRRPLTAMARRYLDLLDDYLAQNGLESLVTSDD